jgi:hypothetical protein
MNYDLFNKYLVVHYSGWVDLSSTKIQLCTLYCESMKLLTKGQEVSHCPLFRISVFICLYQLSLWCLHSHNNKGKDKFVSVHAMKSYGGVEVYRPTF